MRFNKLFKLKKEVFLRLFQYFFINWKIKNIYSYVLSFNILFLLNDANLCPVNSDAPSPPACSATSATFSMPTTRKIAPLRACLTQKLTTVLCSATKGGKSELIAKTVKVGFADF